MKVGHEIVRIIVFGLVGAGATLLHMIIAQIALTVTSAALLSSFIGFVPAFIFSFIGHRYLTFGDVENGSIFRFFVVAFSGFGFSVFVLQSLDTLQPWLSLALSILIIPLWTYFMARLWVFRSRVHTGQCD